MVLSYIECGTVHSDFGVYQSEHDNFNCHWYSDLPDCMDVVKFDLALN